MSASDSDPARAPRAPETTTNQTTPPTRRFSRDDARPGEVASRVTSLEHDDAVFPQAGDVWSHEVGTRRFEPGRDAYPVAPTTRRTPAQRPEHNEPSIVTKAFEQTVPPPAFVEHSTSASAFVTDALSDLTADDATRPASPPRRIPGTPSTPPPGFGK